MNIITWVLTSLTSLTVEYGLIVALIAAIVVLAVGGCYSTLKMLRKRDIDRRMKVITEEGEEEETGVVWVKVLNEYRNNITKANLSEE